jgi:excisionase family DNA binding protein
VISLDSPVFRADTAGMGNKPDELISTAEAARVLKLSVQQVRTHARNGNLPAQRVGRDWVFRRKDVNAFTPAPRGRPKG